MQLQRQKEDYEKRLQAAQEELQEEVGSPHPSPLLSPQLSALTFFPCTAVSSLLPPLPHRLLPKVAHLKQRLAETEREAEAQQAAADEKVRQAEWQSANATAELQSKQAEELRNVEERIRSALEKRDAQIAALTRDIEIQKARAAQAEKLLEQQRRELLGDISGSFG